jgi:hypothetical protein
LKVGYAEFATSLLFLPRVECSSQWAFLSPAFDSDAAGGRYAPQLFTLVWRVSMLVLGLVLIGITVIGMWNYRGL